MSIASLKNRVTKRINLKEYKSNYTDIGSFIKRKRKELDVTQDEISSGICSISYLSKIENNQIIPNDFYVHEIMEKLDVDQSVYTKSIKEKEYLDRMIRAIFYMDDEEVDNVYHELIDVKHNLVINLCKLAYTIYFDKDDECQFVMMLEHLVNNMNDYEVCVYLYLASSYFVSAKKYRVALELIQLTDKLHSGNNFLKGLLFQLSYVVKQRLIIKNCSNEDYYSAMAVFNKYHNVQRIIELALQKSSYLMTENPVKALEIINTVKLDLLSSRNQDYYAYLKAKILFELCKYNESLLTLKKIEEGSIYYLRKMNLLLMICAIENDCDMALQVKTIMDNYKPNQNEMEDKVYYHYLTQENDDDKKEYLRDIAIPFSIKIEDYYSLEVYTNKVMEICINNSRYKEALQYYKKYQKEITRVKNILY